MGLDNKEKPVTPSKQAFIDQKETGSLNPGGRPRGALGKKTHPNVKERLLGKWQTHPVDKLVEIANHIQASNPEKAAEIWTNLLKYFEPTKKPVEVAPEKTTPEESKAAAEETMKLLREIEENGYKQPDSKGSNGPSVEPGSSQV